jgi:hypothetical protein
MSVMKEELQVQENRIESLSRKIRHGKRPSSMFMPTVIETPEKRGFPQPFEPANEVKNEDSSDEEEEDDHNDVSAG